MLVPSRSLASCFANRMLASFDCPARAGFPGRSSFRVTGCAGLMDKYNMQTQVTCSQGSALAFCKRAVQQLQAHVPRLTASQTGLTPKEGICPQDILCSMREQQ